ncbi:MAG: alpha/beta hydrolase [Desulfobacterales bacterium]
MANITANGIQIEYDTFGEKTSPPLLLVMGLGAQMILWDEGFCEQLADKGLYVIRFDNRDIGLSTKFEDAGVPNMMEMMTDRAEGKEVTAPYSAEDMADDAVGLLDALGIEKAHICGASMGGMIIQTIGYRHPSKVLSLVSIMSTTGDPSLPQSTPEAMTALTTPAPSERDAYLDHSVKTQKVIGSPGFPFDEEEQRQKAARSFDRSFYPQGMARQMAAIMVQGNRRPELAAITAPTLVIHGADDPLVPVEGGKDTADAIPGAELLIIEGMGHSMPEGAWPQIVGAISEHTRKVSG